MVEWIEQSPDHLNQGDPNKEIGNEDWEAIGAVETHSYLS